LARPREPEGLTRDPSLWQIFDVRTLKELNSFVGSTNAPVMSAVWHPVQVRVGRRGGGRPTGSQGLERWGKAKVLLVSDAAV